MRIDPAGSPVGSGEGDLSGKGNFIKRCPAAQDGSAQSGRRGYRIKLSPEGLDFFLALLLVSTYNTITDCQESRYAICFCWNAHKKGSSPSHSR